MRMKIQPKKLEIGACRARPRISDASPSEAAVAYQFAKRLDTSASAISPAAASFRMRPTL
jgi:hypothetical protein